MTEYHSTEIAVKGNQDTALIDGPLRDVEIRRTRYNVTNRADVVANVPQRALNCERNILIAEKSQSRYF